MSDPTITAAIIAGVCSIIVGALTMAGAILSGKSDKRELKGLIGEVATDAKAAREGVTNEHESNLRDDLDAKFSGVSDQVASLSDQVSSLGGRVTQTHTEVRMMRADVNELRASDINATEEHSLLWRAIKAITPNKE